MQVHFVAVEIGVIRIANAFVKTERPPRPNLCFVAEDTQFVERRLAIEEDNVAILKMTLHNVAYLKILCNHVQLSQFTKNFEHNLPAALILLDDIVGSRMLGLPPSDAVSKFLNIILCHLF